MIPRLKELYYKEIQAGLKDKFSFKNIYMGPKIEKVVKVQKKYNAHDENNKFKTGDKVSIIECKPFSKNKKFQVMDGSKWYRYKLKC